MRLWQHDPKSKNVYHIILLYHLHNFKLLEYSNHSCYVIFYAEQVDCW